MNNSLSKYKDFRQVILLDEHCHFVGSNDVLFSTAQLESIPLTKWFPFIESVIENIKDIKLNADETIFSRVESPAEFLPGSYDFTFQKINVEGKVYIKWCIYDYTNVYTYLTKYQQLKNEKDIYRQQLEFKGKKIEKISDLIN